MIPAIDICIATYKRPELLRGLLLSLLRMNCRRFKYKIYIVDNDPDRSAERVVAAFKADFMSDLFYGVQPVKNIALTRNQCIRMGEGEFIAIVDDDEVVSENWLTNLLNTIEVFQADVVFGKVVPQFSKVLAKWPLFARSFRHPDPETGATDGFVPYTTNCLMRRSVYAIAPIGFDPAFGLSGGSDTEFFSVLKAKGARFVYCREGITYEDFSTRAKVCWVVRRQFRIGITCEKVFGRKESAFGIMKRIGMETAKSPFLMVAYFLAPAWFSRYIEKVPFDLGTLWYRFFQKDYLEYR